MRPVGRYADYAGGPPTAAAVDSDARPQRRSVDRLREAAQTGLYWVLRPEADGTWTLRHLDDATGLLGDALHTSDPVGNDPHAAFTWAGRLCDATTWQGTARWPGGYIEEAYALVRELTYTPRPPGCHLVARIEADPSLPGMELLVIRERWSASGQESDPLYFCEASGFDDRADMLQQISGWFGVEPRWTCVVDGAEYHHQPTRPLRSFQQEQL